MGPEHFAIMIPIVALMIPIVAILTRHQQKMAELMHGGVGNRAELDALHQEIRDLRQLVHQQTIQIDTLNNRALAGSSDVRQNLSTGA